MKLIVAIVILFGCNSQVSDSHLDKQQRYNLSSKVEEDTRYGTHNDHTIDVYFPNSKNKNDVTIFYVHGGWWNAGDKREAVHWAEYFQNLGYTVICLNYRLTNTSEKNIHPAQVNDIATAIQFSLTKSDWHLNKDRCIIMGPSAGGHLAALYAYAYNKYRNIKIAVILCGILNLTDERLINTDLGGFNGGTMISRLIGDSINSSFKWKAASPLFYISTASVPTIFVHGKKDEIVPYEQSVTAYNQLKGHKIATELILLDTVDHDLLSIDLSQQFNRIDQFIKSNL